MYRSCEVWLKAGRHWTGRTPLHWACRSNNAEIVEPLLDVGAALDAVDGGTGADADSVIGLGDPAGCTGSHGGASFMIMMAVREGESRLDTVVATRIHSALESAKKERLASSGLTDRPCHGLAMACGGSAAKRLELSASAPLPLIGPAADWTGTHGGGDGVVHQQAVGHEQDEDKQRGTRNIGRRGWIGISSNIRPQRPGHGMALVAGPMSPPDGSMRT